MKLKDGYFAKDSNGDVYWYDEINVKDIRPFKIFRTVTEAIDWINE